MNNYIAPNIEFEKIEVSDVILASNFQIAELAGVDADGSKSAIFDAAAWF